MTTAELELATTPATTPSISTTMKALVYHGPGKRAWVDKPRPTMEKLWDRNISLTTRLVDTVTTPMLLKVVRSGKLQPGKLVTHRFAMYDIMKAYDTFGNAAKEGALKVVLTSDGPRG
jgi:threonine dehydrogenase-like Zn-dependent dehydrogenase